ncbi:MAG: right-handed parallel beta-helix repeat-containing protein [Candidatus Cloacimonadota bacterium]|nr:right-handed parallel beta-helix repeat-containing protein [Candidatus Cloacimonadota bacterium]
MDNKEGILTSPFSLFPFHIKYFIYFIVILFLTTNCFAQKKVVAEEFLIDPPTFHCLGFRWIITGDSNANATVVVKYREIGTVEWKVALPLLRIDEDVVNKDFESFKTGNLFAGSILNLRANTSYDASFVLSDPDGGYAEKIIQVSTLQPQTEFSPDQIIHLYPQNYRFTEKSPSFHSLTLAIESSYPGTLILVHPGIYSGNYEIEKSGCKNYPIIIRGTDREKVIFDGNGTDGKLFTLPGQDYIHFENLTLRNAHTAIKANGSNGLVVKNCHIYDVHYGIISFAQSKNWLISNNLIEGRVKKWFERDNVKQEYSTPTGIVVQGTRHIVCYNTIHDFWDCLTIHNLDSPGTWENPLNMCIDFYNNKLYNAADDCMELDFGYHNIRAWNNQIMNSHVGISTQPIYGGPAYIFRNFVYNSRIPLKLHNWPSGLFIFNNTFISSQKAFWSDPIWQNAKIMNNLFLGIQSYAFASGSPDSRTFLDYNGYYKIPNAKYLIKWSSDNRKSWGRYSNLQEFYNETGNELHGIMVDYNEFANLSRPIENKTYKTAGIKCKLSQNARSVNSGIIVPNITDNFIGSSPDIGCLEFGDTSPHFGCFREK